ncbi:MAG: hypothetical protein E7396_08645 [Ruminococcaceae bacterium]|nr:hypothetical protein [Oscillospiraceae bacterium]
MKKCISVMLVVIMMVSVFSINTVFADAISVTINQKAQSFDVMPIIENGRTLVPMRGIFEALGAEVVWDDATKTVTGTKDGTKVTLQIGNQTAKVDDKEVSLDVAAKIIEGRTMVPVRFISESLGCKVDWDDVSKTVIINSGYKMAKLISEYHRKVPTEFDKSNDLYDNYYFKSLTLEEQEEVYEQVKSQGEVVCTEEEFTSKLLPVQGEKYGNYEVVSVEGQNFKTAIRATCTTATPDKSANLIIKTAATPERNPGDGVNKNDQMLLAFRMRCVEGGDENGVGKIQFQIEHPVSFQKALFNYATAGRDWTVIYMPFTGIQDATSIGFRPGFYEQVIELGGVEIINFGESFDSSKLPTTSERYPELEEDAQWRKDSIEQIKKVRKGDFSVIVKDKEGNAIPDAQVEFDMFEHEFQFGNAFMNKIYLDPTYKEKHEMLFNAGVHEHHMKWGPYEDDPEGTHAQAEAAREAGVKYMRGHTLIWERWLGSNGISYLTPKRLQDNDLFKDREKLLEECEKHFNKVCSEFPYMTDWDVANEMVQCTIFREVHGNSIIKDWYDLARKAAGPDCDLYYNEASSVFTYSDKFRQILDEMMEMNVDFDGIGIQSHYDNALKMPTELIAFYDDLAKTYGKRLKVTEFSCSNSDQSLQGNYMRDFLITCFAEENMDGFLMWGFKDGAVFAQYSPIYSPDWTLKKAGKVYIDLVYNKWWTKDAKAITDKDGKATINGFYGDYDVTVTVNGKTVTDMVAFHKGYDNVLEITIE